MKLQPGHVAVVTGAASGIGLGIARACAGRGMTVALADVEVRALADAASSLSADGARVLARVVDVTDRGAVDGFIGEVVGELGPVDLVAANAGVLGPVAVTWEQTESDWQWVLGVNLHGVIATVSAVVGSMVERDHGHVLITSSVAGLAPHPGGRNGPYTTSKYAVIGFAETLRAELAARDSAVGVTILCPGPVATNIRAAGRNRPAAFGGPSTDVADIGNRLPRLAPDAVGHACLEAVEADAPWLLTNVEYRDALVAHLHGVVDALRRDPVLGTGNLWQP